MQTHWAVDLGTTNTLVARWAGTHAETVAIEPLCEYEPAWHTPLIPTVVCFEDANRGFIGMEARAAQELLAAAFSGRFTPLARSFKRVLARDSRRQVAEASGEAITARQCAQVFMRELLARASEQERSLTAHSIPAWNLPRRLISWIRREGLVNDLTVTVPVESFEPYRMELSSIARKLGVQRFRTLDEPVAAALGYGVDLSEERFLMVVDFGGGTLDIAIVRTALAQSAGHRKAEVVAARGMDLGGETVDGWVTEMVTARLGSAAERLRPTVMTMSELMKKELSGKVLTTDETVARLPGIDPISISRRDFLAVLEERGLYRSIEQLVTATLEDARHRISVADLEAVLLVGGSTLLPGVRETMERLMGASRVHYWEPFEAVAKGAAIYGAGFYVDQIIHHDYAIRVFSDTEQKAEYELLIRRGTPYPTPVGYQTRYYSVAPRQQLFSLPVCEVGYAGRLGIAWRRRTNGADYWLPTADEEAECVYTLNEGDALRLAPPGQGPQARLRVDFTVDKERWLCATVHDLLKDRQLRTEERVIRLR
ncbi:MAG: Hsp70 family protein [Armatimonadetes bacterium]|nr:Hsp70 family protein [Armatimonadota bacterium]